jgi:hypothetical protein
MLRCTPHDLTIFDNQWLQLPEHPIPAHDRDLFVEDYLFGWRFDQIRSRLAVLIGNFPTVTGFDGNTVLVLLDHVAELAGRRRVGMCRLTIIGGRSWKAGSTLKPSKFTWRSRQRRVGAANSPHSNLKTH